MEVSPNIVQNMKIFLQIKNVFLQFSIVNIYNCLVVRLKYFKKLKSIKKTFTRYRIVESTPSTIFYFFIDKVKNF